MSGAFLEGETREAHTRRTDQTEVTSNERRSAEGQVQLRLVRHLPSRASDRRSSLHAGRCCISLTAVVAAAPVLEIDVNGSHQWLAMGASPAGQGRHRRSPGHSSNRAFFAIARNSTAEPQRDVALHMAASRQGLTPKMPPCPARSRDDPLPWARRARRGWAGCSVASGCSRGSRRAPAQRFGSPGHRALARRRSSRPTCKPATCRACGCSSMLGMPIQPGFDVGSGTFTHPSPGFLDDFQKTWVMTHDDSSSANNDCCACGRRKVLGTGRSSLAKPARRQPRSNNCSRQRQ